MKITVDIPDYKNGIEFVWDEDFTISTEFDENVILIKANKAGLISLARHLLTLAQDAVPNSRHLHFDEFNSLEDNSVELIIEKV